MLKRNQLILVEHSSTSFSLKNGTSRSVDYRFARIASLSRDGETIRKLQFAKAGYEQKIDRNPARFHVVPLDRMPDATTVLDDLAPYYDTIEAARDALRPLLVAA